MSFAKPDFQGQRANKPEVDETRCPAYGCKSRASVRTEGRGFCCSVHAFAEQDVWQDLTRRLSENDWLLGFIDEMQKMDRESKNWRGFALRFWENSDKTCQPDPHENAIPYQNRMRAELLYRVGQLSTKPIVRIAKHVRPSGIFSKKEAA